MNGSKVIFPIDYIIINMAILLLKVEYVNASYYAVEETNSGGHILTFKHHIAKAASP